MTGQANAGFETESRKPKEVIFPKFGTGWQ
jgi:hypothetical protein